MGALGSRLQTEGLVRVSAHAGSLYSVNSSFLDRLGGSASDVSHFQLKARGPFACFSLARRPDWTPFCACFRRGHRGGSRPVREGCGGHTLPLVQSAALCPPVFLVAWLSEVLLP